MLTQCRRRYRSGRLARNAAPSVPWDEGELLIGVIICPNTVLGCGLRARDLEGWIVLVVKAPKTTGPMLGKCETDSPPRGFPRCFRKLKKNADHQNPHACPSKGPYVRRALPVYVHSKAPAGG